MHVCVELAVNIQQRNTDRFTKAVYDRPKGTPLITISNHLSCIDDPLIWGKLCCYHGNRNNNDDNIIVLGMLPIRQNFINHVRW